MSAMGRKRTYPSCAEWHEDLRLSYESRCRLLTTTREVGSGKRMRAEESTFQKSTATGKPSSSTIRATITSIPSLSRKRVSAGSVTPDRGVAPSIEKLPISPSLSDLKV